MKVSELATSVICQQIRENMDELSEAERMQIDLYLAAAVQYVKSATGIYGTDEPDSNGRRLDDYEDLTVAVLALISDMYDNRSAQVDSKMSANRTVQEIIGRYRFNLVPTVGA